MDNAPSALSYRQAVEQTLRLLDGRWVPAVLTALALRPLRFGRLLVEINAVDEQVGRLTHDRPLSKQTLSQTLDRMQRNGLLTRHDEATPEPSVSYEITPLGRSLLSTLRPLAEWAQRNQPGTPASPEAGDTL